MLTMLRKKEEAQKQWAVHQGKWTEIHLHLLRIIHLEISIQNISLVLSCESHPKCKLKAIDDCINKLCVRQTAHAPNKHNHHCFIPGGNSTSPSLMFLSLKLDIRGLNPQSSITLSLGVTSKLLGQSNYCNGEHARIYSRTKYKRINQIYYSSQSEHSLIIHQIHENSA